MLGDSETSEVWMSAEAGPARWRASTMRFTAVELAASAAAAVLAWLTVPNENSARSGTTVVEPVALTVIPPADVSPKALRAPDGWKTPAKPAITKPTAASAAMWEVFMAGVRPRRTRLSQG